MNKILLLTLFFGLFLVNSCKNDPATPGPDYHVHFVSPDAGVKHIGETINIKVDFEDHNGGTVHHINVKIYSQLDPNNVIFDMPTEPHVHETSGFYEFNENFTLDGAIIPPHTDWVLKASVWGHDDGVAEVSDSLSFHVIPQ
ncbi:MAG: hypothetical protein EPO28_12790 [Saprospiraceae bacterium]|nr:MAG: hypothetical protein EPO28_12790 [Saprospiraceae bacterium]